MIHHSDKHLGFLCFSPVPVCIAILMTNGKEVHNVFFVCCFLNISLHWRIYMQNFPAHAPPPWDPILTFSHTFSPKSACVGGPCPKKLVHAPLYGKSWICPCIIIIWSLAPCDILKFINSCISHIPLHCKYTITIMKIIVTSFYGACSTSIPLDLICHSCSMTS